jgi:hypothetical protein
MGIVISIGMKTHFYCLVLFFLTVASAHGQKPEERYNTGKDLIKKGKYLPAMEALKPLLSEGKDNPYVKHAHYLYALAALKADKTDDAASIVRQLILKYTTWEQRDEARYLNANIFFEQGKFKDAIDILNSLPKEFDKDSEQMKAYYLGKADNMESLKWLQQSFPDDKQIAQVLATKLQFKSENDKDKMLLKYLVQEFKIELKKAGNGKSQKKGQYNVAVLFPFMLNRLQTDNVSRPNQFILDMYQGIKLAVDSLNRSGARINLYAYDTEKEPEKFQELLARPELKDLDLIIGPVYPAHIPLVTAFADKNGIQVVLPFASDPADINSNLTFLFQPGSLNMARQLSKVVTTVYSPGSRPDSEKRKINNNAVLIIYGKEEKDSLLAYAYKKSLEEEIASSPGSGNDLVIKSVQKITRENVGKVKNTLTDSTSMRKVNHIAVFTNDQVVAANIISATEILGFDVPLFTTSDWLDFNLITIDQFERRNVHFIQPDYLDLEKPAVVKFRKDYLSVTHLYPTTFAYQGFDLMLVFGKMLQQNGTGFGETLVASGFIPGATLAGFNYSAGKSNSYIPVVRFTNGKLENVNKP